MNRWLSLATGLVPILSIHITYLIAASGGHVPWCNPYLDSCTSISATGRHGIAWFVFKATMLPYAVLLAWFWHGAGRELGRLGDRQSQVRLIQGIGITAAVFLVVYTVALGAGGDFFQLQRRIGIILYFGLTAFAQLLLTWRLRQVPGAFPPQPLLLTICVLLLGIGLLTVILDLVLDDYDAMEDAFEWVMALTMHCYFLALWRIDRNAKNSG